MADKMRLKSCAYFKGVDAAKLNMPYKGKNPYDDSRPVLQQWWQAGFDDQTEGLVQPEMMDY